MSERASANHVDHTHAEPAQRRHRSAPAPVHELIHLQRLAGNAAVTDLVVQRRADELSVQRKQEIYGRPSGYFSATLYFAQGESKEAGIRIKDENSNIVWISPAYISQPKG